MQPQQLYNQLRFNLEQPYDINKLSTRHKNPKPITIEKAGGIRDVSAVSAQDTTQTDEELSAQFGTLNLARLKEAQFLAQRQLKKQKDGMLTTSLFEKSTHKDGATPTLPTSQKKLPAAHRKPLHVKVSPTKKLHHMPVAGHSPPVKEVPTHKTKPKVFGATYAKSSTHKHSPNKTRAVSTRHLQRPGTTYSNGVLQEKIDNKLSMPDMHRMAMQQLLQVQSGEPVKLSPLKNPPLHRRSTPARVRRRKMTPSSKVKFIKPSTRADAARFVRERIYKQPLARSLPKAPKPAIHTRGRVLKRHPTQPEYDPDYDYVDPDAHLNGSLHEQRVPQQLEKSHDLPNADEFLSRITEARRANEAAERYAADPQRWLINFERETKERLEPLIKQAEVLSENMKRNVGFKQNPTTLYTVNPQYNGGHDSREMSSDDLLHHPVDSQINTANQARAEPPPQLLSGASGGDAPSSVLDDIGEGSSASYLSHEDMSIVQSMINRLDAMEKENVEIRQRWLAATAKYGDTGLVPLDDGPDEDGQTRDTIFETPRPVLLRKTQSEDIMKRIGTQSSTSPVNYAQPQKKTSTTTVQLSHNKNTGYREAVLSLPERKIKSVVEGKKRFERYLDSIGHTSSAGFDPWKFAQQTADEVLETCIAQVSNELFEVGDGIVQRLYSDEFVAAKHHTDSECDVTAPT